MKRHLFYSITFLLVSGLMLNSCNKESFELNRLSDEIELQPSLVAPLIYGSMMVGNIVELVDSADSFYEFDDGLIYLAYMDTLVEIMADTMVEVPNKLVTEIYIDSVFDGDVIILGASLVDDQGSLTQAVEETTVATFPVEKLGKLQEVFYMQFEARMITSELGGKFVKFYSDYSLDFKLSMYANLRINTRELK